MEGAAHHETVGCQGRVCCSKGENLSGWKIHQRRCGHLKSTDPTQTGWGGRTPHPGQHPSTPSHSAGSCFPDTQTLLRLPGQAGEAPLGLMDSSQSTGPGFCGEKHNARPHLQGQLSVPAASALRKHLLSSCCVPGIVPSSV